MPRPVSGAERPAGAARGVAHEIPGPALARGDSRRLAAAAAKVRARRADGDAQGTRGRLDRAGPGGTPLPGAAPRFGRAGPPVVEGLLAAGISQLSRFVQG